MSELRTLDRRLQISGPPTRVSLSLHDALAE